MRVPEHPALALALGYSAGELLAYLLPPQHTAEYIHIGYPRPAVRTVRSGRRNLGHSDLGSRDGMPGAAGILV
jgi:hypothetical protein